VAKETAAGRLKLRKAVEVRGWCVKARSTLSSPGGMGRDASQCIAGWVKWW